MAHEFTENFGLRAFSANKFGVLSDIVDSGNVVEFNESRVILIKFGIGHVNEINSSSVHFTADSTKEFIEGDNTVVVFIEEFKDALELGGAEFVAVFTEAPHEFIAVEFFVTVVIHASEDVSESTDSMGTSSFQSVSNFGEDLVWGLSAGTERGVNVRVVTGSTDGEHVSEFFIIKSAIAVFVKLTEDSVQFVGRKGASEGLKSFFKFCGLDSTETVEVEVFKDFLNSSAFIISSMSALTDLLENDIDNLVDTSRADLSLVGVKTPNLKDHIDEVVFFLEGHDSVDLSVIVAEVFARNGTVGGSLSEDGDKIVENGFGLLLTGHNSRVSGGVVTLDKSLKRARVSSLSNLLPGELDDGKSLVAHVALKDVNELRVGNLSVFVEIKSVVDGS